LRRGVVEGQQLLDQRESDAGLGRHVQPFQLQLHVGVGLAAVEDRVFFLEVEQRARRDRDHQLVVQGCAHG
jgi:hypothetical protein